MFCRNCGAQLPDGAKFCPNCGTPVWAPPQETTPAESASEPKSATEPIKATQPESVPQPQPEPTPQPEAVPQPEPATQPQPEPEHQAAYTAPQPEPEPQAAYTAPQPEPAPQAAYNAPQPEPTAANNNGISTLLKVIAIIGAVLYAYWTIRAVMSTFGYVIELFTMPHKISTLVYMIGSVLNLVSCLLMALALVLFVWRRTKENTEYMFMTVGAAGVVRIAAVLIRMILSYIVRIARHYPMTAASFTTFLRAAIYAVIIVGILFVILYASGNQVLIGRSGAELSSMLKNLPNFLSGQMDDITAQQTAKEVAAAEAGSPAMAPGAGGEAQSAPRRMKTNRSFIVIILLGIITCGIYNFYIYYTIARDLNVICEGDGKKTMGIVPHVLLSLVTCGIFEYFWQYSAAERMADNGPRFNANIHEGGSTILLWMIIGTFVCCLGTYFAMYFQIKNLNTLSAAYNRAMFGDE